VSVAAIQASYKIFPGLLEERESLKNLVALFNKPGFKRSETPIQCFIKPGNEKLKKIALELLENNLDARPILYPTVPLGEERLRITLHSFNTAEETNKLISILSRDSN
jgi:8-amino-7-oxononanoate synthase